MIDTHYDVKQFSKHGRWKRNATFRHKYGDYVVLVFGEKVIGAYNKSKRSKMQRKMSSLWECFQTEATVSKTRRFMGTNGVVNSLLRSEMNLLTSEDVFYIEFE